MDSTISIRVNDRSLESVINDLIRIEPPPVPATVEYEDTSDANHLAGLWDGVWLLLDPAILKGVIGFAAVAAATKTGELVFEDFYDWVRNKFLKTISNRFSHANENLYPFSARRRGVTVGFYDSPARNTWLRIGILLNDEKDPTEGMSLDERVDYRIARSSASHEVDWSRIAAQFHAFEQTVKPFVSFVESIATIESVSVDASLGYTPEPLWDVYLETTRMIKGHALRSASLFTINAAGEFIRAEEGDLPIRQRLSTMYRKFRTRKQNLDSPKRRRRA
ncbi:MAG: hypothetical protein QOK37_1430 [Thermoanaerobaculia bacterium]|jgi:hypothetical protein|nr:hypothetical protein [Thermoanaerobaculia bacterium]